MIDYKYQMQDSDGRVVMSVTGWVHDEGLVTLNFPTNISDGKLVMEWKRREENGNNSND